MTKIRALVVDDELLGRQRLISMLHDEPIIEVIGEAHNGAAAVQKIVELRPDLVFLDVQMPGLDGFGVLRCSAGAHQPLVVFVTAHDAHALRAFDVHAADYLLKPVTAIRLRESVQRVCARRNAQSHEQRAMATTSLLAQLPATPVAVARIAVRVDGETQLIAVSDITRVEAGNDHLVAHLRHHTLVIRETLNEFDARLEPFGFVRVHRSTIVNGEAVRSIESIAKGDYFLTMRDGARVRSGRSYRAAVQSMKR